MKKVHNEINIFLCIFVTFLKKKSSTISLKVRKIEPLIKLVNINMATSSVLQAVNVFMWHHIIADSNARLTFQYLDVKCLCFQGLLLQINLTLDSKADNYIVLILEKRAQDIHFGTVNKFNK